jgi:GAF domain-containing protein
MAKTRTPKDDDEEKIMKANIQKRFKDMFSGLGEPLSNMSLQEVESLRARIAQLEKELEQGSEKAVVVKGDETERQLSPSPFLSESLVSNPTTKSPSLFSNALSNISMRWKMGLMVFVFLVAMVGIAAASHVGLQAMRYHLSNIYDFMLIPILAISEADTALADSQYHFENLDEVTGKELTESIEHIQTNTQQAAEIISRYDTEWVTTTSSEFTQALREAGKLELQQQEVASLEAFHSAFAAAQETSTKYLATVQAGNPDANLAEEVDEALASARVQLDKLININNEFASLSNSQAQSAYGQAFTATLLVGVISIVLVFFVSYLIVVSITNRLGILTHSAAAMQEGKLDQFVSIAGRDEVSLLGSTFNTMALRLKDMFTTMEQRVQDRTHDLELASEVGRTIAEQVANADEMLTQAVEIIRARFNLYYTQIYLTDPSGKIIVLRAGTGDVGRELLQRGHHLTIDLGSLNGRAAFEKRSVIVADTRQSTTFLPNPLLPNTHSEISIPLIVGEKVVGVLDMQSELPGALNETNLPAFEALAGQLAIAVQNAALFTQAEEARATVEAQIRQLTEQGWQDFLDAIERGQKVGFEFKNSQIARLESDALLTSSQDLTIPITVTGTKIGEIQLPIEQDHTWTPHEQELIKVTSAQLAQHIENLRLLAQAERYRAEAEQALQRLTQEGWSTFLQTHKELESGYLFDLTEVKPLAEKSNGYFNYAVKQTMIVGDQVIGELAVDMLEQSDEAAEVIAAVAEQLSGHIENLRLSELNERHAQREQTLRQITSALRSSNNPAAIMRTAVRELGSIMGRRAIVQLATAQRADQAESAVSHENASDATAPQS